MVISYNGLGKGRRKKYNVPSKGPIARPSCPDDLNCPKAFPFASSGCVGSSTFFSLIAFPWAFPCDFPFPFAAAAPSAGPPSSHCNDACAVSELTTVADVNAIQTAAAWRSRNATVG